MAVSAATIDRTTCVSKPYLFQGNKIGSFSYCGASATKKSLHNVKYGHGTIPSLPVVTTEVGTTLMPIPLVITEAASTLCHRHDLLVR